MSLTGERLVIKGRVNICNFIPEKIRLQSLIETYYYYCKNLVNT